MCFLSLMSSKQTKKILWLQSPSNSMPPCKCWGIASSEWLVNNHWALWYLREQQKNATASWKLFQVLIQMHWLQESTTRPQGHFSIQFKKFTTYLPSGAIQTCKQLQQLFIHIYKITQVHRTNTGKHNLHVHTKTYP